MIHSNTEHAIEQVISTCVANKEYFVAGLFEACLTLLKAGKELEVTQAVSRLAEEHGPVAASAKRSAPASTKKAVKAPQKRQVSEQTRRKLSELAKKNWQARRAAAAKKAAAKRPQKKAVAKKAPSTAA